MSKKILSVAIPILLVIVITGVFGFKVSLAQESDNSEDPVREKVKERIEGVLKKPKAFLGTITDKTGDTLQIKNIKGEIQFISGDPDQTSFVSIGKTSRAIKYDDVALGDFIIAMGYVSDENNENRTNGRFVLEAKRVLVTEEVKAAERSIHFGKVAKIERRILTIISADQEISLEFPRTWKGPEISEIFENDRVAVVSIPQNGKTMIRTIEVIEGSTPPTPEEE
jgi:hypothetical protein